MSCPTIYALLLLFELTPNIYYHPTRINSGNSSKYQVPQSTPPFVTSHWAAHFPLRMVHTDKTPIHKSSTLLPLGIRCLYCLLHATTLERVRVSPKKSL